MWSVSSTECPRTPDTPNGRSRSYAPGRRFDCPGCISRSFRWCRCFPRMFSAALIFFADSNLVLSVNAESAHSIPCDPSRLSHAEFSERQSSPNFFQQTHFSTTANSQREATSLITLCTPHTNKLPPNTYKNLLTFKTNSVKIALVF